MTHRDSNIDDQIKAEHDAMDEAEAVSPHAVDEAEIADSELLGFEAGSDTGQTTPAELAAIHTDTESVHEAEGIDEAISDQPIANPEKMIAKTKPTHKPVVRAKASVAPRSQRYLAVSRKFDRNRNYPPADALALVKETGAGRFDTAVELHIRLLLPKSKKAAAERYRSVVILPHGTGKEPKIGILDDALIEKIAKAGDTEFDTLLATPAMMPKVAKIAKILGPKGKMPNPKTGTVSDDLESAKKAIASGRVELRADAQGIIHQMIGRVSWPIEKLTENYQALLSTLPVHRLQRVSVCATFGPGILIAL